jgi:uncharacterized membrane protein
MPNFDEKVSKLQGRLIKLIEHQEQFQREIAEMRAELALLKSQAKSIPIPPKPESPQDTKTKEYIPPQQTVETEPEKTYSPYQQTPWQKYEPKNEPKFQSKTESKLYEKLNLEKFIGENLISLIGIIILTIGVAIGAKYAIDKNWITPLMRIVAGYMFGIGLVGLAVKLKSKYLNYSAVLLSGGMAIMYFITFFAYTFYALINQPTAFVLMLIFTVFTVVSALNYDRQVIAHIGLVGAYAIPFLLSNDSGNYAFLFTYIAILNIGILAISIKKYWKPLFYSSYIVTWLIFSGWYATKYSADSHFYLGFFFLTAFFLIFYLTFLAYKLVSKENIALENVALILTNSFIFFGFGYSMLDNREGFEHLLGMFTIANAAIHFAFAFAISRLKLATLDLVYLTSALVLTFITISVPVQLDGNFITLIWAAEAAILFWIGRTKQIPLFENYSYPLMFIASVSLFRDWATIYFDFFNKSETLSPFFNRFFAVGLFFVAAFAFIWVLNRKKNYFSPLPKELETVFNFTISTILLFVIYNIFRIEIGNYYDYQLVKTAVEITPTIPNLSTYSTKNEDLYFFNVIWQINYTMLFLTALSFINIEKFKNAFLGFSNLALNAFIVFIYITIGLYVLGELRRSYFFPASDDPFAHGIFNLLIRYFCYIFFAAISYASLRYTSEEFLTQYIPEKVLKILFDLSFYFSVLVLASVELINWMEIFNYSDSFKLGLSILWGVYSLFLIVLGIIMKKVHLRIFAITLFAVILLKLFFYDIADLDTISKTVVFVSLGILLLIISFLYTKYKNLEQILGI